MSLADTTSLVGVICYTTPLVASLRTLSKCRWELSPVVCGIDIVEPAWVGKVGIDDLLRVDEEVLGCTRYTGILVRE